MPISRSEEAEAAPAEVLPEQDIAPPAASAPLTPPVPPGAFAAHALADDAATLDPEHPLNANLRNAGVALVPRLAELNDEERRAAVDAGAVMARPGLPYGWHIIDDGARTLVFEAAARGWRSPTRAISPWKSCARSCTPDEWPR